MNIRHASLILFYGFHMLHGNKPNSTRKNISILRSKRISQLLLVYLLFISDLEINPGPALTAKQLPFFHI